ncbi:MAG: hypothetical protein WD030_03265 [Pirellulales bacterium]
MSMVHIWLPIALAGVANHVLSTVFWMMLPFHKREWKKLPDEDEFMDLISFSNIPPGQYVFPLTYDSVEMRKPSFLAKQKRGTGMLVTWKKPPHMLLAIVSTLGFFLLASFVIGYLAMLALEPGTPPKEVFRFVFTAGILAHCSAKFPYVLWFRRRILLELFDGVAYAAATAAIFAALWPDWAQ